MLGLAACASSAPAVESFETLRDQEYAPGLKADVFVPRAPGLHPIVLMIHGGGWYKGEPKGMEDIARRFAAQGYVVVNAAYRFAPANVFPAQLADLSRALLWIRDQASRRSWDERRLSALGYSAGGHLALMLAYAPEIGAQELGIAAAALPKIRAVIAGGSPTDLPRFGSARLVRDLIGSSLEQNRAAYERASPLSWASKDSPPTFLFHGTYDFVVDVSHSRDLKKKLEQVGVPCEFSEPTLGHIYTFFNNEPEMKAALVFLEKLFSTRKQ